MSAAETIAAPLPADDFWDAPRDAAEFRQRIRDALVDDRRAESLGFNVIRSPADLLFLVDELVAQVRREERAQRGTP